MPESARTPSERRRAIAQRVADAHRSLAGEDLLALVSGSVVEGLADTRSDVDMAIVFAVLPAEEALRNACGASWIWQLGAHAEGNLVVAFTVDDIEVQIAYSDEATLARELDQVLVAHDPDTPLHKLAEGLLKAEPLAGAERLRALQARIAEFPAPLAEAMAAHYLGRMTTPWRAIAQIVHRDAALWCRELQVQLGYRLVGALAGLNGLYFTTFQFKRMSRFVARMAVAPDAFAARLEQALGADPATGFAELHALEAEVLALVAQRWPALEGLASVRERHAAFPGPQPRPLGSR